MRGRVCRLLSQARAGLVRRTWKSSHATEFSERPWLKVRNPVALDDVRQQTPRLCKNVSLPSLPPGGPETSKRPAAVKRSSRPALRRAAVWPSQIIRVALLGVLDSWPTRLARPPRPSSPRPFCLCCFHSGAERSSTSRLLPPQPVSGHGSLERALARIEQEKGQFHAQGCIKTPKK